MQPIFVRSPYNYDRDEASRETGLDCEKTFDPETGEVVLTPSLTKQAFKEECDINVIVARFAITGELPTNVRMPSYADFADVPDFRQAMEAIRASEESFMALPAEVRARFHNDPAELVDFCSDSRNLDEARKLGLVPAAEIPPEPAPVPAAPPAQPTPGTAPPTPVAP